jgi:hypothetical protein
MPQINRPGARRATATVFAVVGALALLTGVVGPSPLAAAAANDATLFGTTVPAVPSASDAAAVELGVTFIPRVNGSVSGVRFYKGAANTGTHTGSLWNAARSRLATATFSSETASGWQTVSFAKPVPVAAGQSYVASYNAPRGRYAVAGAFFKSAFTRGDLTVPVNGGVYRYGTSGFPGSTYNASNYYVDLVFQPAVVTPPTPDTRAPVITATKASAVSSTTATISWTTDEPATTQVAYGKTTAYGTTTTRNASLTTSHSQTISGLTASTTYHFQARSSDAAGNSVASVDASFTTAATPPPSTFNPGNPNGTATVPAGMGLEDVSAPDRVIGDGTAASCTSAAVLSAVTAGGVITFNCGPNPKTITLTQTAKVRNSTKKLVIDGGGKITLSGGNAVRILYIDTCDSSLGSVSGNCLYAPTGPQVTVQNITLADGNATNSTYVSPGDTDQGSNGGGAIFALGGNLKVVKSAFIRNTCAANGPDLGGGAIRVLAQHSATPNSLDASQAARNQDPVYIVQSTFGGASGQGNKCSNGGAISGLRTPITVLNSLITYNNAIGCCSNPANAGTPGGGSGGAIYTDGTSYDLNIGGSDIENNSAKAGGSAIFYVSNDRTGHLKIDRSVSKNNTYAPSGQPSDPHFQNYPGIFYLGNGAPTFTNSTIQ